uniref:Fibroblast growth factor 15 n=1 Tax=Jaculus jaculus TaxID=51337 RepID=A0A8C5P0B9_JACJA|nr:fibroblast growth factor 19 [Jaculus jaculus]
MWSAPSGCVVARALVLAVLWLTVAGSPLARRPLALSDQGPHLHYGWGQPIRLRHLYAAGPYGLSNNCFLRIHSDGTVGCEENQSEHSLLEIRAVALKTVAIKDINSVRYLCMSADGKMQGLAHYSEEDCAFKEEINYGYNVYSSPKHRLPVALSGAKAKQQVLNKGTVQPSYFLPMLPKTSEGTRDQLESDVFPLPLETDSMDPFRMVSEAELVKSPSFQK